MKIYLIRHGETTGDLEDKYGGDYDDSLSENGKQESKDLACKLKDKSIQVIYHSPRIRATETAQIVNQKLQVNLEVIKGLRERNNYGILTRLIKSEAKKKYPEEVEKLQKSKLHHNIRGSEDYDSFKKRVENSFREIIKNSRYDTIAIISHGGPISCIVREVLKLGEFEYLGDCAILEIEYKDEKFTLVKLDNASLDRKTLFQPLALIFNTPAL